MERPLFGDYFVLAEIAQGGMGTIFRAKTKPPPGTQAETIVAIKCMHLFATHGQFDAVQAFRTEAALALKLQHPNIVRALEIGDSARGPYMVMEWLDGKTLREVICRAQQMKTGFPAAFCAHLAMKTASALSYTHDRGILHRDVSPQNIMSTFDGQVKVIDFGIAKMMEGQDVTKSGVIKGKPSYLSPEQVQGDKVDERTDIFNVGIVLWELLTQRKLFQGKTVVEIIRKISDCDSIIRRPSEYNPSASPELDAVVMKALAQDPAHRYQTAAELALALAPFAMSEAGAIESQVSFMRHLFAGEVPAAATATTTAAARAPALTVAPSPDDDATEVGAPEAELPALEIPAPLLVAKSAAAAISPSASKNQTRLPSSSTPIELDWSAQQRSAATPSRYQRPQSSYTPQLRATSSARPSSRRPPKSGRSREKTKTESLWRDIPQYQDPGLSGLAVLGIAAALLFLMAESKVQKGRAPASLEASVEAVASGPAPTHQAQQESPVTSRR